MQRSIKVSKQLRNRGINTELYPDPNVKLEKQLKYANQKGIPYVLVIGPEEVKNNTVVVRDMKTREQKTVSKDSLPNEFIKSQ